MYAQWVLARLEVSRKKLAAALERIQAGWRRDENVDSLVNALTDLQQCGAEGMDALGAGSADASVASLAEETSDSASGNLGWLVVLSMGMGAVCFGATVCADGSEADFMEFGMRILVAEVAVLAAICMAYAHRRLGSSFTALDKAIAAAGEEGKRAAITLAAETDAHQDDAHKNDAFSSRKDEWGLAVTSLTYSLAPRSKGVKASKGGNTLVVAALYFGAAIFFGQAVRQFTNTLGTLFAIEMNGMIKMATGGIVDDAGSMKQVLEELLPASVVLSGDANLVDAVAAGAAAAGWKELAPESAVLSGESNPVEAAEATAEVAAAAEIAASDEAGAAPAANAAAADAEEDDHGEKTKSEKARRAEKQARKKNKKKKGKKAD